MKEHKGKTLAEWRDIAVKNGIKESTFNGRIYILKWNLEDASKVKTGTKTKHGKYVDLAEQNGISRGAYYQRYHSGWNPKKAATTPMRSNGSGKCKKTSSPFMKINTIEKYKEYINIESRRIDSLNKIAELENESLNASEERQKEIDEEILELGNNLIIPRRQKRMKEIYEKGKDMTIEDIQFLKNQGVTKKVIIEMIGMNESEYYRHHEQFLGDII